MKTLFIDTHLNDILIFLLDDGHIISQKEVIGRKNNSEVLFPTIIKVIDGINLNEIIVVNGPGSFTSVRLGVTIAKTLAYSLNIPIKTISSLECFAISASEKRVAINDGNGSYLGEFDNNYKPLKDFVYVNNSELINIDNIDEYKTKYCIDAEKVYEFLKSVKSINAHSVKPLYIKKIGVEIDKKSN